MSQLIGLSRVNATDALPALPSALAVGAWLLAFYPALFSAAQVWYVSEIFTHCFFVLPGALYLLWCDRHGVLAQPLRANYWVLLPLVPVLALGMVGFAGDIRVFTHIAAFASLSLSVWLCIGNAGARAIWFPLLFVLFSIPLGEELVPLLQEVTADLAVPLLKLSGVPIYKHGLYIDIPAGRFVVAEACSGISFLIASTVLAALYAHLAFRALWRQAVFILLGLILPILANAVRVYGIIIIGHLSDMKYATGVDHLVYGWVFFGLILLLLFIIGEYWRTRANDPKPKVPASAAIVRDWHSGELRAPLYLLSALFGCAFVWQLFMTTADTVAEASIDKTAIAARAGSFAGDWLPVYPTAGNTFHGTFEGRKGSDTEVFIAWYGDQTGDAELISSINRVYRPQQWSVLTQEAVELVKGEGVFSARYLEITSGKGQKRAIVYWYEVSGLTSSNKVLAKLYQTLDILKGGAGQGAFVALSVPLNDRSGAAKGRLIGLAEQHYKSLYDALPFQI